MTNQYTLIDQLCKKSRKLIKANGETQTCKTGSRASSSKGLAVKAWIRWQTKCGEGVETIEA